MLEAVTGADAAVIVTEWDEFRQVAAPRGARGDGATADRGRPQPARSAAARAAGFAYESVGRPADLEKLVIRGLVAALIFFALLLVIFKRPLAASLGLAAFMLLFYVPAGYYIDTMMWRKRERARIRAREAERRSGARRRDAHRRPGRRELLPCSAARAPTGC